MSERNLPLEFCAANSLSIMNTWFQRKVMHQGTWTHPATKRCHMIDFVVMRAGQKCYCKDVWVMRGANCWTDYKLVRVKLNIVVPRCTDRKEKTCKPLAVHELNTRARRDEYQELLQQHLLDRPHNDDSTAEGIWDSLKDCIGTSVEEAIGRGRRRQFEESSELLVSLIRAKNRAHLDALRSNTVANRKKFRRHQRSVKRAVDKAREEWICRVAREGEAAVKDGHARWDSVRGLQQAHAERRPTRPTAVMKEDGALTQGEEEVTTRWYQHFVKVLNILSEYRDEVISDMPLLPPTMELDLPPTEEELSQALDKLKMRKAGGKSGILLELILYGGPEQWERMLKMIGQVWEDSTVVRDWKEPLLFQRRVILGTETTGMA